MHKFPDIGSDAFGHHIMYYIFSVFEVVPAKMRGMCGSILSKTRFSYLISLIWYITFVSSPWSVRLPRLTIVRNTEIYNKYSEILWNTFTIFYSFFSSSAEPILYFDRMEYPPQRWWQRSMRPLKAGVGERSRVFAACPGDGAFTKSDEAEVCRDACCEHDCNLMQRFCSFGLIWTHLTALRFSDSD